MEKWRFWIDRGGTFTDIIGVSPEGHVYTDKRPSSSTDGGLSSVRDMLGLPTTLKIPSERVSEIRIGATIATNALLERKGAKTAALVTRGFGDALIIGDQTRPNLFGLENERRSPLWTRTVEIDERISASGKTIRKLEETSARREIKKLSEEGFSAIAIALMHGFSHPRHEKRLMKIAESSGIGCIVASHESAPFIKFIPRAMTAIADAYLHSSVLRFTKLLREQCEAGVRLLFMQSNGSLVEAESLRAVNMIMSGPAGGVVGAQQTSHQGGFNRIISFDMGGTSTDVALADEGDMRFENEVGGARFFAPMIDIHTVAAGGGSIVRVSDGRLIAGPHSAGATPGPACYRQGGPATITDCNAVLGKLNPTFFPSIFGKKGDSPLDIESSHRALREAGKGTNMSETSLAEGFIQVAVENMAAAVRRISVSRGADPSTGIINSFGGASGQHICMLAESVGAKRALVSRRASVLSAWGIGRANIGVIKRCSSECSLSSSTLPTLIGTLEKQAISEMPEGRINISRRILCRYEGVESLIPVRWERNAKKMRTSFESSHFRIYGFRAPTREVIAAAVEVETSIRPSPLQRSRTSKAKALKSLRGRYPVIFNGRRRRVPFYDWDELPKGEVIRGPAIITDKWNTVSIDPGWKSETLEESLLLSREKKAPRVIATRPTPAMLEIFNRRFMAVAEQMGETLRRTAVSVNIRERLDFSCALFDRKGSLLANAPHIPVHLGSMSDSVRHVIEESPRGIDKGDVFMLNSPYHGGTHLPDITLIRGGRLDGRRGKPDYYVASRGHHADIGGVSPGSMPARSSHIAEEGICIELFTAVKNGELREREILNLLKSSPHPARNPDQNLSDLRAQIASLSAGISEMTRASSDFGSLTVESYMRHVQNNASRSCSRLLKKLKSGKSRMEMDDGSVIEVSVKIGDKTATFDFTGTSRTHRHNFNAPKAVVYAAVIYCLRVLTGEDMPLNDGIMRPVRLRIPKNSMLSPSHPAAVAAGNVEVSQHIADGVFAALGVCANSQGTCNNFTFGIEGGQYYETICGGGGASRNANGGDAMQVHMTNSRASDPEILENRHPIRLESFTIRRGSGGVGKNRGGNGAERRLLFLKHGEAAILSSRRKVKPQGILGGKEGSRGKNMVLRKSGKTEDLGGCAQVKMTPGDTFIIQTPGGGGYGRDKG